MEKKQDEIKEVKSDKEIKEIKSDKKIKEIKEDLKLEGKIISAEDFEDFEMNSSDFSRGPSLNQSEVFSRGLEGGISGFENVGDGASQMSSRGSSEDFKYNLGGGEEDDGKKYVDSSGVGARAERVDAVNIGRDFNSAQTRDVGMINSQETFDSPMQEKYMDVERVDAVNIRDEKPGMRLGEVERKYEVK